MRVQYGLRTAIGSVGALSPPDDGMLFRLPLNTVAPVVSGSTPSGSVLTCTTGTWTSTYPITSYTYQWLSGTTPVGSNQNTYTSTNSDIGNSVTCRVTANTSRGSASATSNGITVTSSGVTVYTRWSPYVVAEGSDSSITIPTTGLLDYNGVHLHCNASSPATNRIPYKSYRSGKYVFEVTFGTQPTTDVRTRIGICRSTCDLTGVGVHTLIGTMADSVAYNGIASPVILDGGSSTVATASAGTGDVISVKVDLDNGTIQFFKNGTSLHAAQSIGGWVAGQAYFPAIGFANVAHEQDIVANFGQTTLAYPAVASAGFTAGWPAGGTTWDPYLTFGGTYAYSNNDLTLTTSANTRMAHANVPLAFGKWCYELTFVSGFTHLGLGLTNGDSPPLDPGPELFATGQPFSAGVVPNTVLLGRDGTSSPGVTFANGDVLSCLVTLGPNNGRIQFFKNGTSIHAAYPIPAWGGGSMWFPSGGTADASAGVATANFGPTLTYPLVASANNATVGWQVVAFTPAWTVNPVVTGTTGIGDTLSTTNGTVNTVDGVFTYMWLLDGGFNPNDTSTSEYIIQDVDAGHDISCQVQFQNDFTQSVQVGNSVSIPP